MPPMNTRNITLFVLILGAALSRMIPHPWNFTAIGAMALFGSAHFSNKKLSLILPMLALLVSDVAMGYQPQWLSVYAPFLMIGMLGWNLQGRVSAVRVGGSAVLASVIFFVVSNFGVWASSQMYAMNWQGLVQCYAMALPFFGNQVAGDLFFSGALFAGYELLRKKVPALA